MEKRFYETSKQFQKRQDLEFARKQIAGKKLWRITAIEMKQVPNGFQMMKEDHFTVEAYCKEMAIGTFKMNKMNWFVTGVVEETVLN